MIVPELSEEAFRSEFTFEELDNSSDKEAQTVGRAIGLLTIYSYIVVLFRTSFAK